MFKNTIVTILTLFALCLLITRCASVQESNLHASPDDESEEVLQSPTPLSFQESVERGYWEDVEISGDAIVATICVEPRESASGKMQACKSTAWCDTDTRSRGAYIIYFYPTDQTYYTTTGQLLRSSKNSKDFLLSTSMGEIIFHLVL